MYRVYLCGWHFPPLQEVPSPKCLESERLNLSNNGFPFSELAGWKVHDSYLSGTICFYLFSLPHWHHFLLLFISQRWPWDWATWAEQLTWKLHTSLSFSCKGHTQWEVLGLPHAPPGFHTPPAPPHTLSALYRKFATLWPHVKVPLWINTNATKCSWVVSLKYQSCFITGMRALALARYHRIKSEGLRGILMRW